MHLGETIRELVARGNPVAVKGVKPFLIFFTQEVVVAWLWIEESPDHWSVIYGRGEDKEQARRGEAVRIDVSKSDGARHCAIIGDENRGVILYSRENGGHRNAEYLPESVAKRFFDKISRLIDATYHDKPQRFT